MTDAHFLSTDKFIRLLTAASKTLESCSINGLLVWNLEFTTLGQTTLEFVYYENLG